MAIYQLDDQTPELAETAWVADNAQVMGAVKIAADASVWFGVTVRGDTETIWGSMIKDAIKRRQPQFSERFHGFRTFGALLEAAKNRGLIAIRRDEKSGNYQVTPMDNALS